MLKNRASNELYETIFAKIHKGEWEAGYKLPSESMLSEEYGVSRATVREALQELVLRGCIKREQGKGSYVLHTTIDYGMDELMSINKLLERYGLKPSTKEVTIAITAASPEDADALGISEYEPIYIIDRVKCADDVPVVYDSVYIPCKFFSEPDVKQLEGSLFEILDNRGIHVMQGIGHVSVQIVSDEMAQKLDLDKNQPLLCMYNVLYDKDGTALMITRDYYTDRVRFPIRRIRNNIM